MKEIYLEDRKKKKMRQITVNQKLLKVQMQITYTNKLSYKLKTSWKKQFID